MDLTKVIPAVLILSLSFLTTAVACTGIQLKAKNGSTVNGRTVEFGVPLDLSVLVIPRNYAFTGTLPDGTNGLSYKAKYAAVGGSAYGEPAILDGLNEKGLSVAMFYFPGYASYGTITPQNKNQALSPTQFSNWMLTQFASLDEVKQGVKSVVIAPTTPKGWPSLPPFHYIVYDNSGKSLVIEPINGQLKMYDNPIGVLTNSPTFDWHLTNLTSYINLSPVNAAPVTIDGMQLKQFGQGSGMHGLPGDFSPPSRFVRAAIFSSTALPADNAQAAVLQAFHILNQFDIPVGAVRAIQNNKIYPDYTIATTVKDPQNNKYYFRTYDDQTIKAVNMNTFDLNGASLRRISMAGTTPVVDVSGTSK